MPLWPFQWFRPCEELVMSIAQTLEYITRKLLLIRTLIQIHLISLYPVHICTVICLRACRATIAFIINFVARKGERAHQRMTEYWGLSILRVHWCWSEVYAISICNCRPQVSDMVVLVREPFWNSVLVLVLILARTLSVSVSPNLCKFSLSQNSD